MKDEFNPSKPEKDKAVARDGTYGSTAKYITGLAMGLGCLLTPVVS